MDLTNLVLSKVSFEKYYRSRLPNWDGVPGTNASCPFHGEDKNPSFSVNIKETGGCYCHACDKRIGSIIHFEKEIRDDVELSDEEVAKALYSEFVQPVISFNGENNVQGERFKKALTSNRNLVETVYSDLGFNLDIIKTFGLGWSNDKRRLTIPVYDSWSNLINYRYYKLPSHRSPSDQVKIYNEEGYSSSAVLYPVNIVSSSFNTSNVIYWMKAERDTILAYMLGLSAVCSTGGENYLNEEFATFFRRLGKTVIVVGDNDSVGIRARDKKIKFLEDRGIKCGWIEIPPVEKDFSDWILNQNQTVVDFQSLEIKSNDEIEIDLTAQVEIQLAPKFCDVTDNVLDKQFTVKDISSVPEILNCAVEVKGIIIAQPSVRWAVPNVFNVDGVLYRIPIGRELLQLIGLNDSQLIKQVQKFFGTKKAVKPVKYVTVSEVEIIPVIVPGIDSAYIVQKCFFFGVDFVVNLPYKFKIIPTSKISNQTIVGLIYEVEPLADILSATKLGNEDVDQIYKRFHISSDKDIYESLVGLANELSERCTLIYNRVDLHIAQLLTWISPLEFYSHKEGVQRGWLNTLVLGDTQTGKSEIAQKLRDLFHCGAFISSENCTFVGLIGGAIKSTGGGFMLRWGKIPLYNKQLVVLEELSGLTCEEISKMSDVRSSGIARLDKGGLSGETSAKTRLLCISNVRRACSNIDSYPTGVLAVQELIGQNEDVSRFDLILTVTDHEVSNDVINSRERLDDRISLYNEDEKDIFRKLMMFAWNIKPEQINIPRETHIACLETTNELAEIYHSSIPIFKAGSGRHKLARIAIAIAALTFSWDKLTNKLIVEPRHVEAAKKLLMSFYNKPSLGYGKYSMQRYYLEKIVNEDRLNRILDRFLKGEAYSQMLRYIIFNGVFEKEELVQSAGIDRTSAELIISSLLDSNIIKKSTGTKLCWETTYAGRKWLERKYEDIEKSKAKRVRTS